MARTGARKLTDRVRVERPVTTGDESGQQVPAWTEVATCWAAVEGLVQGVGGTLPDQAEQMLGRLVRRVTVYRDAVPGVDEDGTRWRVVVVSQGGRATGQVLHVHDVAAADGPFVTLICRGEQRA